MAATATPPVQFVVVPFLPEHQPALGVSSLAALLASHGIASRVHYLNLDYHRRIGPALYQYLSRGLVSELLLGEMVFAAALWGRAAAPWESYVERFRADLPHMLRLEIRGRDAADSLARRTREWQRFEPRLGRLAAASPRVIAAWARALLGKRPRVLALTSTFQQNVAALALAREVRRLDPGVTILLGGANCEDDMGRALAESFPFVDHVVSGEGEGVIVPLVERALSGRSRSPTEPSLGELRAAGEASPRFVAAGPVTAVDTLPVPSFDDYFAAVRGTPLARVANLVAESARGCWWGAKAHCTFCGLNGTTMAFRSKSPARLLDELRLLARRYRRRTFLMADNILDMSYVRSLFPELAAAGDRMRFFYETKSNLRKEQLEAMAAGGVFSIQPGIESLSADVLRRMDKGTTPMQNLQLLKWCAELGIAVQWNLLYGFPGEAEADYKEMAELIPALVHLPEPFGVVPIRLDRFSPYWKDPARHGLGNVRPYWAYDLVYRPLPPGQRARIAYFFEFDYQDGRDPSGYAAALYAATASWRTRRRAGATLERVTQGGATAVLDSRWPGRRSVLRLAPLEERLLAVLDGARTRAEALRELGQGAAGEARVDPRELEELLTVWLERRWLVELGGRLLSLVLDRTARPRLERRRLAVELQRLGVELPAELSDMAWLRADPLATPRGRRRTTVAQEGARPRRLLEK